MVKVALACVKTTVKSFNNPVLLGDVFLLFSVIDLIFINLFVAELQDELIGVIR